MNSPTPKPGATELPAPYHLEASLTHLLHRVGQCATDSFQRYAGDLQITARQFAVLMAIARMDGASQVDVVKLTGIDRSTLADMVGRMLNKGLIQRQRSKVDGRAYCLSLTDAGRTALDRSTPAAAQADDQLLAALDPDRRRELLAALTRILQAISSEGEASDRPTA